MSKRYFWIWRERLQVLRNSLPAILFWPAVGLAIAVAAWFLLVNALRVERGALERETLDAVARMARTQATQTRRSLDLIDQILMLVRLHWKERGAIPDLSALQRMSGRVDTGLNIAVFDAAGRLRFTNGSGLWSRMALADIRSLPFFKAPRDGGLDEMFVGTPQPRMIEGDSVVRLSRRLDGGDAGFAGVVVATVSAEALLADVDRQMLGEHGFIAAVGRDGVFRGFQHGYSAERLGALPPALSGVIHAAAGARVVDGGTIGDGHERYLGWLPLDVAGLSLVVGVDRAHILRLFRERERTAKQTAAGASVVLLVFVLTGMGWSIRVAFLRYRLEQARHAYRVATEGGSEGFFIVHAVNDAWGQPVDFITVDCNESGPGILGLAARDLVHIPLSALRSRLPAAAAQRMFRRAMQRGASEHEFHLRGRRVQDSRYLRVKAVRADDGVLAVTLRDITAERGQLESLERKSHEDALTGLPNRTWVNKCLPEAVEAARRDGTLLSVLFIDLDGFKHVNDTFGHAAGDELLRIVAKRLQLAVRPSDRVARLGGDEFIVLVEGIHHAEDAAFVAARVVTAFRAAFTLSAGSCTVGTSIGVSVYPDDAQDVETLLGHADIAMYSVKTSGKNDYRFFDAAFYEAMQWRARRERELRTALDEGQFLIHYQPRIETATGRMSSVEALVRWRHPSEGLLGPEEFIPLAEETGLIVSIGAHVLEGACAQVAAWSRSGGGMVPVSVNVSARQFNEIDICGLLGDAIARHGLKPNDIEIELTESTVLKDMAKTAERLEAVHALGIPVLVDDFGTGYSSLAMLQELEFDVLKVDKSFTQRLGTDMQAEVLFTAIITMAHALGMKVVAEGVERREQLDILRRLRCDELQGYLISRPTAADVVQGHIGRVLPALAAR
jgi:diguanylate cyclase (GGDEF)-like protein